MPPVVSALLAYIMTWFRSRCSMQMEIIALRHQVAVYKQTVSRPRLRPMDRLLWAWLSRVWPRWQDALEFVQPRTVVAWQKKRFRDYWRRLNQHGKSDRATISKEVRTLIRDMWRSNPTWGSPRIVGELGKLGIHVAKSTVEKYRPRIRKPLSPTWKTFLKTHVKDLVSCDFFTVPTVTYKVFFVFVILAHDRRRIVYVNVTEHPTAKWTAQQLVEAFPWGRHRGISCGIETPSTARSSNNAPATRASKKSRLRLAVRGKVRMWNGSSAVFAESA
jgi:putative transposase